MGVDRLPDPPARGGAQARPRGTRSSASGRTSRRILPRPTAVELEFVVPFGRDRVRGRYDRVDTDADGRVTITDYKSSDVRDPATAARRARESLQLAIYGLAWEAQHGRPPDDLALHFLELGDRGAQQREPQAPGARQRAGGQRRGGDPGRDASRRIRRPRAAATARSARSAPTRFDEPACLIAVDRSNPPGGRRARPARRARRRWSWSPSPGMPARPTRPATPCPDAGVNRAVVVALAAASAGLAVAPFALLAEFAVRRRIIYRGAWARAARRGLLVAGAIAALAGLRLGGALSVPVDPLRPEPGWPRWSGSPCAASISRDQGQGVSARHLRLAARATRTCWRRSMTWSTTRSSRTCPSIVSWRAAAAGACSTSAAARAGSSRRCSPAGASRIVGVDGSAALLRRAEARIASGARSSPRPPPTAACRSSAATCGRSPPSTSGSASTSRSRSAWCRTSTGPRTRCACWVACARCWPAGGRLVLDDLGPAAMPQRDLPLSVDWRRELHGREVVRRSELITARVARRAASRLLDDRGCSTTRWYDSAASGQSSALVSIS